VVNLRVMANTNRTIWMLCAALATVTARGIGARPHRRSEERARVKQEALQENRPVADRLGVTHVDGKYHQ
jgi:hypothetical protein